MTNVTAGPVQPGTTVSADKQAAVAPFVDQAAALLGIPVDAERRAGVAAAFAAYSDAATLLMTFPLPVEMEQASIYVLADGSDDR
jgi:hypothetical protein